MQSRGRERLRRAPLATAARNRRALDRARDAQRAWRSVRSPSARASCTRFCDAFEAQRDAIAQELTWQMGRPIRYAPNEVRGTLERARHMIAIAPRGARRPRRRAEGKLHALRAARAARRGVHRRGLELPVPHRGQQRGAGAHGGQRGGAQALRADAAVRRALRELRCREAGLPDGVFQVLH